MSEFASPNVEVPRDSLGRPLVIPPDGGRPVPYTRTTTLAGAFEDKEGLVKWKCRHVLRGALMNEWTAQVLSADTETMNALCEAAADTSGANDAARLGTAWHEACEHWDRYHEVPDVLPSGGIAVLDAYRKATERLAVLDIEQFGVLDEHKVGGTWDRAVQLPAGRAVVADIKTGDITRPQKIRIQLACYARSVPYLPDGTRRPSLGLDLSEGIVIHLDPHKASCDLYSADLELGWADALFALEVRQRRRGVPPLPLLALPFPTDAVEDEISALVRAATDLEALRDLWRYYSPRGEWTEVHTAIAVVRKSEMK